MSDVVHFRGTTSASNTTGITEVSSINPFPVIVTGSSSSAASTGGGNSTYSNVQGDFTATANAGTKTITFSAYANTVLSSTISTKNFTNAIVKRISSAGVVDSLPLTNISFSANVLTLSDMTANFAVGDTVAVFISGNDKAFDETNDVQKIAEQFAPQAENNTDGIFWEHPRPITNSVGAITLDVSTALEASTVTKAGAGRFYGIHGRIDKTAPTGEYWILVLNAASVPADGTVTILTSFKQVHINNTDNFFDLDYTHFGIYASTGIVVVLSTTEFTKTIAGAYLSSTVLYL